MKTRDILCDAGSLISLTSACLDSLLHFFAEKHKVRFIIPPGVEFEAVSRPLRNRIKKHMFSAMRIKNAIDNGIVVPIDVHAGDEAKGIMEYANNLFYIRAKPINLIHFGEAEMAALAEKLGVDYVFMDERTGRLLVEAPFLIKKHLEKEFGINVMINKKNFDALREKIGNLKVIRSSEITMLAYEAGFFRRFGEHELDALEAALFKMKFAGCSISFAEIDAYLKSVK